MSAAEATDELLEAEVVEPFRRIERVTGRAPRIGAWRGGTRFDARLPGNRALRDLGLTHLVSNWSVEAVDETAGGAVDGAVDGALDEAVDGA